MPLVVRRAASRSRTDAEGRTTWHSFAFGAHYDPADVGFGTLVAHNEEVLPPGTGYAAHHHRDVEIVSVVLSGRLRHESDVGSAELGPGAVQHLSAGAGVTHAETNPGGEVTRFVQTWLRPGQPDAPPAYVHRDRAWGAGLTLLAETDGATLHACVVDGTANLPAAPWLHLYVVDGEVRVGTDVLAPGDTARLGDEWVDVAGAGRLLVWAGVSART